MELYKTKHAWILGGFEYLRADDVIANAGVGGATFRTDQLAGGQHVPFTKIMSGTADDTAVIPGDATNGLFVQVKTSALPSGAATAAKQPALGTAGSSSTDVISVQGIASGTALPVSVASIPSHAVTNAGTFATQVDGAALTSLQLIDDPVIADDSPFTPATSKVMMAGFEFDDSTPDSVDEGDAGAARMSANRNVYTQIRDAAGNERGVNVSAANALKVDASGAAVPITDNSGSLTVDSPQLPAALGQTTMAASMSVALASNQSALPITDNSGSLTVDNGGTFVTQENGAALTSLQLIDDVVFAEDAAAVSGDKGIPLLAVRRDSASSGVSTDGDYANISVDSTGALRVTGGGGGTQYAEDTAHVSGDSGTLSLAVRRDANTSLVDTTGDYAPLQVDSSGSLKVAITSGAGSGGTSLADKAAFTEGSTSMTPVGGVYNETISADPTEDQAAAVRITAKRALHVNLRDASGNELTSGNQYAEDAAHTTGDLGTVALVRRSDSAASSSGTDGDYSTMNTDSSGRLWVNASGAAVPITDNSGSLTVDNGGTFAVQASQAGTWTVQPGNTANTTAWKVDGSAVTQPVSLASVPSHAVTNAGTFAVQAGQAAHGAAQSGNPVRTAIRAATADYTALADGNQGDALGTILGKQVTMPYAIPANFWNYAAPAGGLVSTTAVTAKTAAGAGIRIYITAIQVINSHATISSEVIVNDGAAGTTLHRGWAQAAGGGYACQFSPPLRGTANTLLEIKEITATSTTGILVNLQGYVAAE